MAFIFIFPTRLLHDKCVCIRLLNCNAKQSGQTNLSQSFKLTEPLLWTKSSKINSFVPLKNLSNLKVKQFYSFSARTMLHVTKWLGAIWMELHHSIAKDFIAGRLIITLFRPPNCNSLLSVWLFCRSFLKTSWEDRCTALFSSYNIVQKFDLSINCNKKTFHTAFVDFFETTVITAVVIITSRIKVADEACSDAYISAPHLALLNFIYLRHKNLRILEKGLSVEP